MSRPRRQRSPRLGRYLRRCRESSQLSLKDVSELSQEHPESISVAYLSKSELGQYIPPVGVLLTLSSIYGVRIEAFVDQIVLDRFSVDVPSETDAEELRRVGLDAVEQGRLHRAFVAFEKGLDAVESGDESTGLRHKFCIDLGMTLRRLGQHRIAEEYLKGALADESMSAEHGAYAMYAMARLYNESRQLPLARATAAEAYRIAQECGNVRLTFDARGLLAVIDDLQGNHAAAIAGYEEAIAGLREQHWVDALRLQSSLASCRVSSGEVEAGIRLHRETLESLALVGGRYELCRARLAYARSLMDAGRHQDAQREFLHGNDLARGEDYDDLLFYGHFHLRKVAQELGDEAGVHGHLRALRKLRPRIQVEWPEVAEFDRELERGRGTNLQQGGGS